MSAVACVGRDLTFKADTHEYFLPDGASVPSVTTILRAVGISVDFEALKQQSGRMAAAIELKRDIGVALHADCHAFDDHDLDWATVDPRVEPYLRAWATFREHTGLQATARERKVFHPIHFYCGTLDGIFEARDGRRILVDIKTGDPEDSGCRFQTAAYEAGWLAEHEGDRIDQRWGVQLTPERAIPYRITPYTDWRDFSVFQACVTTFQHQAAARKRGDR